MTTIVVVRKGDSAVIAADTLTTFGTTRLAPAYDPSQMTVMIANPTGIFAVYSMREVFEFDRFWAIGSGRDFALGAMYAVYNKAKGAAAVAEAGVIAGAEFDTGTALPINLHEVK